MLEKRREPVQPEHPLGSRPVIRVPPQRGGWLEVVCGPMFSGKSEEMIRRLRRAQIDESPAPLERKEADHARLNALLGLAEAGIAEIVGLQRAVLATPPTTR